MIQDQESLTSQTGKKVRNKRPQGVKNKVKGSGAERLYAAEFRDNLGCPKCKTTRNSSRLLDACKIDLNFIPLAVQIKAGIQKGLSVTKELKDMQTELDKHIPDYEAIHRFPKILIHHKDLPVGQRQRTEYESMVHMTFETFKVFFLAYQESIKKQP